MQMDAYLKKEQNGVLFTLVGVLGGARGGGWSPKRVQPKILACRPQIVFYPPASLNNFRV